MADSTYKIIDVVGTSSKSWEDAAKNGVKAAGINVRDLRIAEVSKLDIVIDGAAAALFRARMSISFKYEAPAKAATKRKGK
jgi:dodecin